jgi:hypothetical protein
LQEGDNVITAVATDSAGNTATTSITLYGQAAAYIRLTANTYAGLPPFETVLRLESSVDIFTLSITATDPMHAQVGSSLNETEHIVYLSAPGWYFITAEVGDEAGNIYTYTLALLAVHPTMLDTVLQARWGAMKQTLASRDIPRAVQNFTDETKGLYQGIFTVLSDQLPQLTQEMQALELISVVDHTAKYRIRRTQFAGGQMMTITYYLYFQVDSNGLWKILRY